MASSDSALQRAPQTPRLASPLAGTLVATLCNVAVVAVIARLLGQGALGVYAIAFAVRALLALLCGLGMRFALSDVISTRRKQGDYGQARGSIMVGVLVPTGLAIVVAGLLAWRADQVALQVFDSPDLAFAFRMVAVSLPFLVLMDTCLAATRGFGTTRSHTRIALLLEPVTRLGLTIVILHLGLGIDGAMYALATASVISGAASVAALERHEASLPGLHADLPWSSLVQFALVGWVASLATQGLLWADIVILGLFVPDQDVGVYQVATRLVLGTMVVIVPLTAAMAPLTSRLARSSDWSAFTSRYLARMVWIWRLTLPLLITLLIVPGAALAVFGEGFAPGVAVIYLLAIGVIVEAVAAPSAVLLGQLGGSRFNLVLNLSALVGNIALNLALVPPYGIRGAAVAWALTLTVPGLIRVVAVRRLESGRWPLTRGHAVALGTVLIAAVVARGVLALTPAVWWLQLPVASVVVVVVYVGLTLRFGLAPGEWAEGTSTVRNAMSSVVHRFPALGWLGTQPESEAGSPESPPLDLDQLISPYRYDVLAHLELFELIARRGGEGDDVATLSALARHTAYGAWFDDSFDSEPGLGAGAAGGEGERERAFEQAVLHAVDLVRSAEVRGVHFRPVSVALVPAGVALAGRRLAEDRWMALDSAPRLALLHLAGTRVLARHEYVIRPLSAADAVVSLAPAVRLDPVNFVQFLAGGLVDPARRHLVRSWDDLLDQLADPDNRDALESWPEARWRSTSAP